ncbi:hypothetical protein [Streptomyces wuyuanensis]|uniref:hypothetical protein n=1 Tax=Streptomyces wuyuanensis TaxID=1196353 RepID=UPI003798F396
MGFAAKRKIYELKFDDDEDLKGLEVTLKGLNTGQVLELDAARQDGSEDAIRSMLQLLASQLVEWNMEDPDTGEPVPTTLEGVHSLDFDLNWKIIDAWQAAVSGVSAPLEDGSNSGEPSLEASIPMETLSSSLVS